MNYIKGFRYELHCSARQENTQHCVVWVQTEPEKAAEWNASRPEAEAYPPELCVLHLITHSHSVKGGVLSHVYPLASWLQA